jgi:hypothetical protein
MFSTHLVLIGTNQTTVEHLAVHDVKDREDATLDEMYSCCAFRFVPPLSPTPHVSLYELNFIGWPFQGKVAYATGMGCRVWTYRARG